MVYTANTVIAHTATYTLHTHKIYQKMLPMPLFIFDKRLSLGRQHRFHSSIRPGYHFYYYLFAKMDIDRYRCRFTVASLVYGHIIIICIMCARQCLCACGAVCVSGCVVRCICMRSSDAETALCVHVL